MLQSYSTPAALRSMGLLGSAVHPPLPLVAALLSPGSWRGCFQCHTDEPGATRCFCWCTLHQITAKASGTAARHKGYHGILQPGKAVNLLRVARLKNPTDLSRTQKWE